MRAEAYVSAATFLSRWRAAWEGRDTTELLAMYAEDAVVRLLQEGARPADLAEDAIGAFDSLIRQHGGDRSALDSIISWWKTFCGAEPDGSYYLKQRLSGFQKHVILAIQ